MPKNCTMRSAGGPMPGTDVRISGAMPTRRPPSPRTTWPKNVVEQHLPTTGKVLPTMKLSM